MEFKMLRFVVEDAVAVITLDYAPTLNALDMNLALELEAALKQAEEDDAVKVVVLTGAGRAFCGGGDIRFMKAHCEEPDFADTSMGPLAGKLSEIVLYIKKMKKLVICAVAGAAAGGGCNLALGCDFVFAADNNVPVLPCFITMEDTEVCDGEGYPVQAYTIHVERPIYPSKNRSRNENINYMLQRNFEVWKNVYETTYGIPLKYTCEED